MNVIVIVFLCIAVILILVLGIFHLRKRRTEKKYANLRNLVENLKLHNTIFGIKCKIDYPIFYINMDKHVERRNYMENQLKKISTDFHRIKGFNGYEIKNKTEDEVEGIKFKNFYPTLSNAEIGCTLSHILAIKEAYKSGKNVAIICEDDIMFDTCSLVPNVSKIVDDAPKDWEILQLCISGSMDGSLARVYKDIPKFPDISYIKREYPKKYFWSTACYLINRKGMEKILDIVCKNTDIISITPIKHNPEYPHFGAADSYLLDLVNTYSVLPSLFAANNTDLDSTIHPDHTPSHIEHSLTILSAFDQILSVKQIKFTKTLFDMDNILSRNNQKYFLACGTVLGAIREKKFIEHDDDIDLGIFVDDYNKEIEHQILKKFKLNHRLGDIKTGYEISFVHPETHISIDIFLHYRDKNYFWCPSFFNMCDKAKNKMCRWKYNFNSLKPINFLGRIFNIPDPVDQYLVDAYGPDWQTPRKFSYSEGIQESGYKNLIYDDFEKEGILPSVPTVWQYWETKSGHSKPGYIDYSMDMVKKACEMDDLNYIRLSPDNISNYLDVSELPENWHKISEIAHKADYLRAVILYKYGGLWLDADVIATDSLKPLLDDLKTSDWVVFGDDNLEFSIAIFATRKKSPLLKKWIEEMDNKISKSTKFQWTEIGYDILYPIWKNWIKENRGIWRWKIYKDRETCFPLYWNEWEKFFQRGNSGFLKRNFQPVIDMFNAKFPDWFKKMNRCDFENFIDSSDLVIADMFRTNNLHTGIFH